jgi:hypothetical protein
MEVSDMREIRRRNRQAPKGLRAHQSRVVTIRMSTQTWERVQAIAAAKHSTMSEVGRALFEMAAGDPGGLIHSMAALAAEDLGGSRVEVERVIVDPDVQAAWEAAGQLRLLGS